MHQNAVRPRVRESVGHFTPSTKSPSRKAYEPQNDSERNFAGSSVKGRTHWIQPDATRPNSDATDQRHDMKAEDGLGPDDQLAEDFQKVDGWIRDARVKVEAGVGGGFGVEDELVQLERTAELHSRVVSHAEGVDLVADQNRKKKGMFVESQAG